MPSPKSTLRFLAAVPVSLAIIEFSVAVGCIIYTVQRHPYLSAHDAFRWGGMVLALSMLVTLIPALLFFVLFFTLVCFLRGSAVRLLIAPVCGMALASAAYFLGYAPLFKEGDLFTSNGYIIALSALVGNIIAVVAVILLVPARQATVRETAGPPAGEPS